MNAADAARQTLDGLASPAILKLADESVAAGSHNWLWDPQVDNVVGLIRSGTNRADIVVYIADDDFEVSDEFELAL